ncbi:MAG: hypothetical protein Q9222_001262 [Ikaeria aurantiellina]
MADIRTGCTPAVAFSRLFHARSSPGHDCEDSAKVILDLPFSGCNVTAHLTVSRIGHKETEELIFTGAKGVLTSDGKSVDIYFDPAAGKNPLHYDPSRATDYQSDVERMFLAFHSQVQATQKGLPLDMQRRYCEYRTQDLIVTQTLQAIYQHANHQPIKRQQNSVHYISGAEPNAHKDAQELIMEWPIINQATEDAVLKQLRSDISIYGNGGVFKQFESEFRDYHGVSSWHALLHNSGTNALQALYFAAGFMPGDEVIFPVYTFHATCSPAMHFGITPVFCDAAANGTISAWAIAGALNTKTKAVVVTHMWGMPCNMAAICSLLKQWPKVLLLEDCSHAHGAKFNGQAVGTFGDGAAWSLQGQKIVTGGEGGITLTKHAEFHYRQLIFGHYNKRCKLEIPPDHHLSQFALTGAGIKNRAHPLAIAIALTQLRQLSDFHTWKTRYASQIITKLSGIPFLESPCLPEEGAVEPAWYAFVMRFKAAKAPDGLTRELFVEQLCAKGLVDVDIPRSTGLLDGEPLYNKPQDLLGHVYPSDYSLRTDGRSFGEAQAFYDEAIKFPVYATVEGQAATDRYIKTILDLVTVWSSG